MNKHLQVMLGIGLVCLAGCRSTPLIYSQEIKSLGDEIRVALPVGTTVNAVEKLCDQYEAVFNRDRNSCWFDLHMPIGGSRIWLNGPPPSFPTQHVVHVQMTLDDAKCIKQLTTTESDQ